MEMTMVDGVNVDKRSGVSLDECVKMCEDKVGCSHYNFYYSKIPTDSWSRCVLVSSSAKDVIMKNKNYVLSGAKCKDQSKRFDPPRVSSVTKERGMMMDGSDLKSYSNILTLDSCISLCHATRRCQGYEYLGEDSGDQWNKTQEG